MNVAPVRQAPTRPAAVAAERVSLRHTQAPATFGTATLPRGASWLQAKCACGGAAGLTGRCPDCAAGKTLGLQTRLAVGAADDAHEREADRVADQVLAGPAQPAAGRARPAIQRLAATPHAGAMAAPASVQATLASPGAALAPALRGDMERRFGHDFSRVRVHADAAAQQSARDVHAHAYTAGAHIAFAAGRYAPATDSGRRLLAHELTHVVQQRGAPGLVQRAMAPGELDVFDTDAYAVADLKAYLDGRKPGQIEDHGDSDDKARRIVRLWLMKDPAFAGITAEQKTLLIQEMQSGATFDDDERAILNLLLKSDRATLVTIFSAINPKELDSDFDGDEEDDLRAFYDRAFVGGRKQALQGSRLLAGGADAAAKPATAEPEAAADTAAPVRAGEKDLMVLLDPKLRVLSKVLAGNADTVEPKSPMALAQVLAAIKYPIGTMYVLSHGDDSASVMFGRGWVTPQKLATALAGIVPPERAPALVDFRGCRIGMSPPGMEAIRAALNAAAVVGATCWTATTPLGSGDAKAFAAGNAKAQASELKGAAELLDRKPRACILDRSAAAYIQAGGFLVAVWHSPVRKSEFDELYSRCQTSLKPKVVDPAITAKSQSSISHDCQLIRVERKTP